MLRGLRSVRGCRAGRARGGAVVSLGMKEPVPCGRPWLWKEDGELRVCGCGGDGGGGGDGGSRRVEGEEGIPWLRGAP